MQHIFIADKLHLGPVYANEPVFAQLIRMFWALSCYRPEHVLERYDMLLQSNYFDQRASDYARYFLVRSTKLNIIALIQMI